MSVNEPTQKMVEAGARAMRGAMEAVDYGGEGSEGVAYIGMEDGAKAAYLAMSASKPVDGDAVERAYREGWRDGRRSEAHQTEDAAWCASFAAHAYPQPVKPSPQGEENAT